MSKTLNQVKLNVNFTAISPSSNMSNITSDDNISNTLAKIHHWYVKTNGFQASSSPLVSTSNDGIVTALPSTTGGFLKNTGTAGGAWTKLGDADIPDTVVRKTGNTSLSGLFKPFTNGGADLGRNNCRFNNIYGTHLFGTDFNGFTIEKSVPSDAVFTDTIPYVDSDQEVTGSNGIANITFHENGAIDIDRGKFLTEHPSVTKQTDTTSTASPAHGGTFTVVDTVTRDDYGHVTKVNTKTITLPSDKDTITTVSTTGSGNAITDITASNGALTAKKGSTFSLSTHTHSNYLGAVIESYSSYYAMANPDGTTTDWIRTTEQGILPYESGSLGSGHQSLGKSTWYFAESYIDNMYSSHVTIKGTLPQLKFQQTTNGSEYNDNNAGITCYPGHTTGMNMLIQPGSNIIIGGGEFPTNFYNAKKYFMERFANTSENAYIGSGYNVYLITNGQEIANRRVFEFDSNFNLAIGASVGFRHGTYDSYTTHLLTSAATTTARTWTLPNKTGTIALTSDISAIDSLVSKTLTASTLDDTSGNFFFKGDSLLGNINDWVGIQADSGNDKFQLIANDNILMFRQNDGSKVEDWRDWVGLLTPVDVTGNNGITVTGMSANIGGNTGLQYTRGVNIQHTNSVAAETTFDKSRFKYDAQGHITSSSHWVHKAIGTNGVAGWIKIATMVNTKTYNNTPIALTIAQRGNIPMYRLHIRFKSVNSTDPDIESFFLAGDVFNLTKKPSAYIIKSATSTWDVYIKKLDNYENIVITEFDVGGYFADHMTWTWTDIQVDESAITGGTEATLYDYSRIDHTHSNYLGAATVSGNSLYGMADPDGTDTNWIRTTSQGLIPYESGSLGSGHQNLGSASWYFKNSYIDNMYTGYINIAGTLPHLRFQQTTSGAGHNSTDAGIKCYPGNTTGMNMLIQSNGNIIIGGGEFPTQFYNATKYAIENYTDGGENMYIGSDNNVCIIPYANTITNRRVYTFGAYTFGLAIGANIGFRHGSYDSYTTHTLSSAATTTARTWTLPDETGTIALSTHTHYTSAISFTAASGYTLTIKRSYLVEKKFVLIMLTATTTGSISAATLATAASNTVATFTTSGYIPSETVAGYGYMQQSGGGVLPVAAWISVASGTASVKFSSSVAAANSSTKTIKLGFYYPIS